MYYMFESIALNEIGSSTYQCSTKDIVPVGLSYNDTSYQTCAVSGSLPGHLDLSGRLYLIAEYGFHPLHKWRNVGINAAFFIFFSVLVTYVSLLFLCCVFPITDVAAMMLATESEWRDFDMQEHICRLSIIESCLGQIPQLPV